MSPKEHDYSFLSEGQFKAVDKMMNGCILNGRTGAGKSRTGLYYYFKENGGSFEDGELIHMVNPEKLYIITTPLKRDSFEWEAELANFRLSKDDNDIVIDSWHNIHKYVDVKDAFFIFDEDRVTGNGKWVKCFLKITKNNHWIILSATPGDTWLQYWPVFVANGFYRNKSEFEARHVIYKRYVKGQQVDRYVNVPRLMRLRDRILIDMDVDRLTVPHHYDIWCDYDKDSYKFVIKNRYDIYKDEPIENATSFCYCLRRVVNSSEERFVNLLEILDKRKKAIVFYNFNYERDALLYCLSNYAGSFDDYDEIPEIAEWSGHAHQEVPTSKRWAYLVQYTSGCEGWNCITTDTIIFFSQNYSWKVMEQACGRIDRMNTPYIDLHYYHFKSRSGIDLAISKALKEKKLFNESGWAKSER